MRLRTKCQNQIKRLKGFAVPTVSMFYGIVIYLYFFDNERHKQPHIHARYSGQEASFSIADGALLGGEIPNSKTRLV